MEERGRRERQTHRSEMVKLLSSPFIAALNVQFKMVNKYLETVEKLAFGDPVQIQTQDRNSKKKGRKTGILKFLINRFIRKRKNDIKKAKREMQAPLISLVTIPALTMKQVTVDFALEINSGDEKLNSVKPTTKQERFTDVTPKYIIKMIAERKKPVTGMVKLTEIIARSMEPIKVQQK